MKSWKSLILILVALFTLNGVAGAQEHYEFTQTWNSHELWLETVTLGDGAPVDGDEIAVFTPEGICAGAIVWNEWNNWGITLDAYGDDDWTEDVVEGFVDEQPFTFKLWIKETEEELIGVPEWLWGDSTFASWGWSQLNLAFAPENGGGNGENPFKFVETNDSHLILITAVTLDGEPLGEGNHIAVFTPDELCVGSAEWTGEQLGLAAWSDDPETEEVDGFKPDEAMQFRIWLSEADEVVIVRAVVEVGPAVFKIDGMTILSLDNEVGGQVLSIPAGWSWISMNILPATVDVTELFATLAEGEAPNLLMLKDQGGRFYAPAFEFNNIEGWVCSEGYQIKLRQAVDLLIEGDPIPLDSAIALQEGWQSIAYYPTFELSSEVAFETIVDKVALVKNDKGQFFLPDRQFNNMAPLMPGKGYKVKMKEEGELVYPNPGLEGRFVNELSTPKHYPVVVPTGSDMSVLLLTSLPSGSEIAAYNASNRLVGAGVVGSDGRCGFPVWGSDPTATDLSNGLKNGETPRWVVWMDGSELELSVSPVMGESGYQTDNLFIGSTVDPSITRGYGLTGSYPNPFNSTTKVSYRLLNDGPVNLYLVDLLGRKIATLADGYHRAGEHSISLVGQDLASGSYLLRLEGDGMTTGMKITLIK